jgi:hypothetical protein
MLSVGVFCFIYCRNALAARTISRIPLVSFKHSQTPELDLRKGLGLEGVKEGREGKEGRGLAWRFGEYLTQSS